MPTPRADHHPPTGLVYLLPCALLIMTFLPGINDGFWRVDNPLYAAIAKLAYENASLWTLHAGEQPYFNKPPLVFWVHGLALHLFGAQLWAARLPSFFVALATLLLSTDALRRLAGNHAALASGTVLALTLEYFRAMHSISLDLWMALAITASAWSLVRAVQSNRPLRWCFAAGTCLGVGLMVKPFLALAALPFFIAWLCIIRQWRTLTCVSLIAITAIIVALPWHLSMQMLHAESFWNEYFASQVMDRVTTDAHGSSPWWNYLKSIAQTYWPWLIPFFLGLGLLRTNTLTTTQRRAIWLAAIFSIGWIAMLSISRDKAGRYLIPIYPFASWACGIWLARAFPCTPRLNRLARFAVIAAPAIGLILALFAPPPHQPISKEWAELRAFVRTHPHQTFAISPRARAMGAQIYLMRDQWPAIATWNAGQGEDATGGFPPAGTLLVSRKGAALHARPTDEIIFDNNAFIVWRLTTDWDGNYAVRSDDNPDDE